MNDPHIDFIFHSRAGQHRGAIWSVKAKMTPAESVFSLRGHATPLRHWRCLFWLSSSESKRPGGTKPKAYPLCMGNNEKAPCKCKGGGGGVEWGVRGRGRTVTAWLRSREITLICSQDLHRDAEESSALCPSISICCTWWNYNFHYLIDPIISQGRIWHASLLPSRPFPKREEKVRDYLGTKWHFTVS